MTPLQIEFRALASKVIAQALHDLGDRSRVIQRAARLWLLHEHGGWAAQGLGYTPKQVHAITHKRIHEVRLQRHQRDVTRRAA